MNMVQAVEADIKIKLILEVLTDIGAECSTLQQPIVIGGLCLGLLV